MVNSFTSNDLAALYSISEKIINDLGGKFVVYTNKHRIEFNDKAPPTPPPMPIDDAIKRGDAFAHAVADELHREACKAMEFPSKAETLETMRQRAEIAESRYAALKDQEKTIRDLVDERDAALARVKELEGDTIPSLPFAAVSNCPHEPPCPCASSVKHYEHSVLTLHRTAIVQMARADRLEKQLDAAKSLAAAQAERMEQDKRTIDELVVAERLADEALVRAESRVTELLEALKAAATSLEWLAERRVMVNRPENPNEVFTEIRQYAASRASVARSALSSAPPTQVAQGDQSSPEERGESTEPLCSCNSPNCSTCSPEDPAPAAPEGKEDGDGR